MNTKLNNTINILQEKEIKIEKNYPVKDFLNKYSWLVKFNKKETEGKSLNKQEKAKQRRIYELRDKVMWKIKQEIRKYYETLTGEDYRFHGMPEIERGICGWIEGKIWRLLVEIGEPDHLRFKDDERNYWAEA